MKERWSEKSPSAPGLYWFIHHGSREVRIVEVSKDYGELRVHHMGWDVPGSIDRGLWMKARVPSPPARPKDYK